MLIMYEHRYKIIFSLFKYRKFNKGMTNTFLFEPPALPPPFEGKKTNSKFRLESVIY